MSKHRLSTFIQKIDAKEYGVCLYFNRFSRTPNVRQFFTCISRLGDGWVWAALIILLPMMYGNDGWVVAMGMGIMAAINILAYDFLKRHLARERPYISFRDLDCGTPPLDRYSFPSGHTLHAVSFTIVAVTFFPLLSIVLVPFAVLVGASRVILGLHYPSDVFMGMMMGVVISNSFVTLVTYLLSI